MYRGYRKKRKKRVMMLWIPHRQLWGGLIVIGLLAAIWYMSAPPVVPVIASLTEAVSGKRIVIDAGHGGIDGGASSSEGLTEKELALDIAMHLKLMFSRVGVYTVMVREDDRDLAPENYRDRYSRRKRADLEARVNLANEKKADLYLSIHANSFPSGTWSGAQTFYDSNKPESRDWARAVQGELASRLGPNNRKAKSADYLVLNSTHMPAVLVEVGFLSNLREARLLGDPEYRKKVAEAIFQGTVNFLSQVHAGDKPATARMPADDREPSPGGSGDPAPLSSSRVETRQSRLTPAQDEVVLYFASPRNEDCLMPELRQIAGFSQLTTLPERAKRIVLELIKGPGVQSVLEPTLPLSTRLLSVAVGTEGTLYLDFDDTLVIGFSGGGRSEEMALYSLINSLTETGEIRRVFISIGGRHDVSLGGHIALDRPFFRNEEMIGLWKE